MPPEGVGVPRWLKILALVVAAGVVGTIALGVGGVLWFRANKDRLVGEVRSGVEDVVADAERFAATADAQGCLDESLARLRDADGVMAKAMVQGFLMRCLERARETPGFCEGVPRPGDALRGVAWELGTCAKRGMGTNRTCASTVRVVRAHCAKRATAAKD